MKDLQLLLYFVGVHSCETSCRKKSRQLDRCNGIRSEVVSAFLSILIASSLAEIVFSDQMMGATSARHSLFPDGYCFDILNWR